MLATHLVQIVREIVKTCKRGIQKSSHFPEWGKLHLEGYSKQDEINLLQQREKKSAYRLFLKNFTGQTN